MASSCCFVTVHNPPFLAAFDHSTVVLRPDPAAIDSKGEIFSGGFSINPLSCPALFLTKEFNTILVLFLKPHHVDLKQTNKQTSTTKQTNLIEWVNKQSFLANLIEHEDLVTPEGTVCTSPQNKVYISVFSLDQSFWRNVAFKLHH